MTDEDEIRKKFKIRSDREMPVTRRARQDWPFKYMKKGESAFFPDVKVNSIASRASSFEKGAFSSTEAVVDGVKGVLCFRMTEPTADEAITPPWPPRRVEV